MGAEQFGTRSSGKTVEEAFEAAREQAFYDYGHAGYTGTIAEKSSFHEVKLPTGVTAQEFLGWLQGYRAPPEVYNTVTRRYERTGAERFDPETPEHLKQEIRTAYAIYEDKWGPALAIQTRPNQWLFTGWASS
jgi:hypothetical protein